MNFEETRPISTVPKPRKDYSKICPNCGNVVNKRQRTYCNNSCQQAYQRRLLTQSWLIGEIEGGNVHGCRSFVRRFVLERANYKCEKCGWDELHPITGKTPLQINHINGDPFDHRPENLEAICPNCHSLTDTFGNLNRGNGRKLNPKSPIGKGRGPKLLPP
jgi:predicted RNA-binding Zn-ribbon protein involved in translation (DUF1610 family)